MQLGQLLGMLTCGCGCYRGWSGLETLPVENSFFIQQGSGSCPTWQSFYNSPGPFFSSFHGFILEFLPMAKKLEFSSFGTVEEWDRLIQPAPCQLWQTTPCLLLSQLAAIH